MEHAQKSAAATSAPAQGAAEFDTGAPLKPRLAAYDFDGTLTIRDSFLAYLQWRCGALGYHARLFALAPAVLAYGADRDRGRLKARLVETFLRGVPEETVAAEADIFADAVLPALIRPDALARWRADQAEGLEAVIVTASPEILVAAFGRRLGASRVIGTRLVTANGRLTGQLEGPNCRGPEKVSRIRAAYGAEAEIARAYGDTRGDAEMLAAATLGRLKCFTARP